MYDVNITVNLAALLMISIVFLQCLKEQSLYWNQMAFFLPMLAVNLVMLISNALLWAALKRGNDLFYRLFSCLECVCYYAELALFLNYGAERISRRAAISPWYSRAAAVICAVSATGWVLSAFTDSFYILDENGVGAPGPLYLLGQVGGYLVVGMAVLLIVRYFKTLGKGITLLFLSFALFPVLAAVAREFWRGVDLMPAMFSLSLLLAYSFVHVQDSLELRDQEVQAEKDRVAAALARLQPEALYRTLDAARGLCDSDSVQAQQTIAAFADDLRERLDKSVLREENEHEHFGS